MEVPELEFAAIPPAELNIEATLDSGQCFRWSRDADGIWRGVIGDSAVWLRPAEEGFFWQTGPEPFRWDLLERYFALDVPLAELYAAWTRAEPRIAVSLARHAGLRILRQDPEEAFFSFLCASCNTITKIKRSVSALARRYGDVVWTTVGWTAYRFPTAGRIARADETDLRHDLWGYRAPRLVEVAQIVTARGGRTWLDELAGDPYERARAELRAMPGIGPKIADCICLFALGHDEAVPIDTHVRQAAERLFRPDLVGRSLTEPVYDALTDSIRGRFGHFAGWVQQYLFYDELLDTPILFDHMPA